MNFTKEGTIFQKIGIGVLTPDDYSEVDPTKSVFGRSEYETIAENIMVILSRTGNQFRKIS